QPTMAEETLETSNTLAVDARAHALEIVGLPVDLVRSCRTQVVLEAIAQPHGSGVGLLDLAHVGIDAGFLHPGRCDHGHLDVKLDGLRAALAIAAIDLFLHGTVERVA